MPEYDQTADRRKDVAIAYDSHDPQRLPMVTCAHCGKKTPATNVAPGSIGGGTAVASGGAGAGGGGG